MRRSQARTPRLSQSRSVVVCRRGSGARLLGFGEPLGDPSGADGRVGTVWLRWWGEAGGRSGAVRIGARGDRAARSWTAMMKLEPMAITSIASSGLFLGHPCMVSRANACAPVSRWSTWNRRRRRRRVHVRIVAVDPAWCGERVGGSKGTATGSRRRTSPERLARLPASARPSSPQRVAARRCRPALSPAVRTGAHGTSRLRLRGRARRCSCGCGASWPPGWPA